MKEFPKNFIEVAHSTKAEASANRIKFRNAFGSQLIIFILEMLDALQFLTCLSDNEYSFLRECQFSVGSDKMTQKGFMQTLFFTSGKLIVRKCR